MDNNNNCSGFNIPAVLHDVYGIAEVISQMAARIERLELENKMLLDRIASRDNEVKVLRAAVTPTPMG